MKQPLSPRFPQVPLEHVPGGVGNSAFKLLHVNLDRPFANQHASVLEAAGYQVSTVSKAGDAARRLQEDEFDAVIVGHGLSREQKAQVIGAARASRRAPWIVGLYHLAAAEASGTHVAVDIHDGPEAVLSALQRLARPRKAVSRHGPKTAMTAPGGQPSPRIPAASNRR